MIEAIRLDCPSGHPIAAIFFDSAHLNYSLLWRMAPDLLGLARAPNCCRVCGKSCAEPQHKISSFENFTKFKAATDGDILLPEDFDVDTASVLIVSEAGDGEPCFFSMSVLAKLPSGNPSAN